MTKRQELKSPANVRAGQKPGPLCIFSWLMRNRTGCFKTLMDLLSQGVNSLNLVCSQPMGGDRLSQCENRSCYQRVMKTSGRMIWTTRGDQSFVRHNNWSRNSSNRIWRVTVWLHNKMESKGFTMQAASVLNHLNGLIEGGRGWYRNGARFNHQRTRHPRIPKLIEMRQSSESSIASRRPTSEDGLDMAVSVRHRARGSEWAKAARQTDQG